MSAITGLFERRGARVSDTVLTGSRSVLSDGGGGGGGSSRWAAGSLGLGHQPTVVLSEHGGDAPPWHDGPAGLVVTADVRLDNRHDLFAALSLTASPTVPDSRLLSCAWQKWGRDCPRHLVGDFAFAIWDARQHTLFCARDHIGARPFYYSLTAGRLVFASDIRSVLAVPEVSDRLDEDYVAAVLLDKGFCLNDRTYFAAVRKLPAGCSLTVERDRERLERYWVADRVRDVRFSSDAAYADAALDSYREAVRDRLQTNHPVGVHLSGGLDSSSVAALAARERRRQGQAPPVAFCWQPPPPGDAEPGWEHAFITAVCTQEGLAAHYCPMTAADTLAVLKRDPTREPVTSTMIVESTTQQQAAAQGIRLILSGWGGDEGLSSYGTGYCAELLLRGRWKELYRQSQLRHRQPWRFIAREALLLLFPDRFAARQKLSRRSWRAPGAADSFIHPDYLRRARRLRPIPCREAGVRSTLFWTWEHGGLTERIESWHAHGARHGIAYAYPMLDRRLLEFVAGLPPEQLIRGKWKRWLMRRAMQGILPAAMRWHEDKSDPVRYRQGQSVVRHALIQVGEQLAAAPASPSRARYVDMPRLLQRLRPESLQQNPRVGDLLRTVQFLDF